MLEKYVRAYYQRILVDPLVKLIARNHLFTPNKITVASGVVGVAAGVLLFFDFKVSAIICILLSGYLDTMDGTLARIKNMSSAQGSTLDIVIDRLVEFFILLGLFLIAPQMRGLACICLLGSFYLCITSFLIVGIFSEKDGNKSFHYSSGLIERAEVFIFFILMILFPSIFNLLAWVLTILVLYTTIVRIYQFYQYQKGHHGNT